MSDSDDIRNLRRFRVQWDKQIIEVDATYDVPPDEGEMETWEDEHGYKYHVKTMPMPIIKGEAHIKEASDTCSGTAINVPPAHFSLKAETGKFEIKGGDANFTITRPPEPPETLEQPPPPEPPPVAEFFLTVLMPKKEREAFQGDLNQKYTSNHRKFGKARASRLYCAEVLQGLFDLARRTPLRRLLGAALVEAAKRMLQ